MEVKIFILLALIAAIAAASHFGGRSPVTGTRELTFCSWPGHVFGNCTTGRHGILTSIP